MKLLHTLTIDDNHYVLVFDNNSLSNYNRFICVVPKENKKDYLTGHTMKDSSKEAYKEEAREGLKFYLKDLNKKFLEL